MIADYYFIRNQKLSVDELYRAGGAYWFGDGVNWNAVVALVLGIVPNVPGFLMQIGVISTDSALSSLGGLYNYAWFIGFGVSAVVYVALMQALPVIETAAAPR